MNEMNRIILKQDLALRSYVSGNWPVKDNYGNSLMTLSVKLETQFCLENGKCFHTILKSKQTHSAWLSLLHLFQV